MFAGRQEDQGLRGAGSRVSFTAAIKYCNITSALRSPAINKEVFMTDKGKQANSKQHTGTILPGKAHNFIHSSLEELIGSSWHHEAKQRLQMPLSHVSFVNYGSLN